MISNLKIIGVILAGGNSERMGQDKAMIELGSQRLIDIVFKRLMAQTAYVITNAPMPIITGIINVPDLEPELKGPLAGLLAAFTWAEENIGSSYAIVTVAVDTPFFPTDLVARLESSSDAMITSHKGEIQPTFGFWPDNAFGALTIYRQTHKQPSIRDFAKRYNVQQVAFEGEHDFFNINTPEDLVRARKLFKKFPSKAS